MRTKWIFRLFIRLMFRRDLALAVWGKTYQYENGNDLLNSFIDIFDTIVEKHASIKTVKISDVNFKKSKLWLTQVMKF